MDLIINIIFLLDLTENYSKLPPSPPTTHIQSDTQQKIINEGQRRKLHVGRVSIYAHSKIITDKLVLSQVDELFLQICTL